MLTMVAAIDENRGIGKSGNLLCHLPGDLENFKRSTYGGVVVMGRSTYESLPVHPLPQRRNIVLSRDPNLELQGAEVIHSIPELFDTISDYRKFLNVYIIGGASLYSQFINLVDKLYITHIHHTWEDADVFFPEIDLNIWECIREEYRDDDQYPYTFARYVRKPYTWIDRINNEKNIRFNRTY